ncbi:MAG: NUDIX domain-containing protein [Stellaceae bacterium]
MSDDGIAILGKETVHQGFFRVDRYRLRHRLYRGGWSGEVAREVFERGCTVGVLLYDPDADAVVLVEQFRLAYRLAGYPAWQAEIVAGIVHPEDGSVEAVARRETVEEAGVSIEGALLPITRYMPSPGGSTEVIDLFCARTDARRAHGIHGLADENEDTKVVVLGYRVALGRLRAGAIPNGPTALALCWLMARRARLRRHWPE